MLPDPTINAAGDAARAGVVQKCQVAFSLGWHLAELELPSDRTTSLAGLLCTADDALAGLERAAVKECLTALAVSTATSLAVPRFPVTDPLTHEDVIRALLPFDHRLAEAYLVGKGLFNIAAEGSAKLAVAGGENQRVDALIRRISELKSCFQPYATDAVVATLVDWRSAMKVSAPNPTLESDFRRQAAVWRALLSGDKLATDYIQMPDYVGAARQVTASLTPTVSGLVRTPIGLVLLALILAALGLFIGGLVTHAMTSVFAGLAAGLGWLGISMTTVNAAVKKAVGMAEQSLWRAELGAAVALAVTTAPPAARDRAVRELSGRPRPVLARRHATTRRSSGVGRIVR